MKSAEREGLLDDPRYKNGLPADHPVRRRENVFSFSSVAASLELMQMLSIVVPSGVADVGAQVYHFTDGTIGKEKNRICGNSCFFNTVIARGDRAGVTALGRHAVAEQAR